MTVIAEFQAVVLAAGKGSRLPEITAGKPKCLLPVGNKPLVWYPLFKLQQTSFHDVILVVYENQKQEIQTNLDKTDLKIRIDYVTIPSNEDLGTADTLRLLNDKIKTDLLVLSCDVITDVKIQDYLNVFRMHNASLCALFFPSGPKEQVTVPGPKSKHKPERDLIGIDKQTNRLVFVASASDFEEEVCILDKVLERYTCLEVHSDLVDSHVYLIKNWIVKYLQHNTSISTIKGELLPHITKKQHPPTTLPFDANTSVVRIEDKNDIFHYAKDENVLVTNSSTYKDHIGDMNSSYHGDPIRCYAFVAPGSSFGVRLNTLHSYWQTCEKVLEIWEKVTDGKGLQLIDPKATVNSSQVDNKCIIWDSAKLNEKTSFKNSIIGSNTEVKSFTRVFNSVVMNNVTVEERVALENCIVCNGATIGSNSQLKNCIIGSNHAVPEHSQHSNEVLTDVNRLMEF